MCHLARCLLRNPGAGTAQLIEQRQAFLEVERRVHRVQVDAELHHGEGDLRLDSHDDGLCAAQVCHLAEVAQRPGAEGVQNVQGGDVDDDTACAFSSDLLDQVALETLKVPVIQRRVDGGDEVGALRQDGNAQRLLL